jgi:hypothetical protein
MPRRCENVLENPRTKQLSRCDRDVLLDGPFCYWCSKVRCGLLESKARPEKEPSEAMLQRLREEWDLA